MKIAPLQFKAPFIHKSSELTKERIASLRYLPDSFLPAQKIGSYEDFMDKIHKVYGDISLKKLVRKCRRNELGHGQDARVFGIPKIDDYVLKVNVEIECGIFSKFLPLEKVKNDFYVYNFGQKVATNKNGISVLLKTQGKPSSFPNWIDFFKKADTKNIKDCEALYFLKNHLAKVAELPQESFDRYAKKIYFLQKVTNRRPDMYNPNNVLIDYKNKEINIIDVCDRSEKALDFYLHEDMIDPLIDNYFYDDILKALPDEKKLECQGLKKIIIEKCKKAAEKCGLLQVEN